jgi:hypothetical protein
LLETSSIDFLQGELLSQVKEATASGYRLEVHAIGDAAADMVISCMEKARVAPETRPILTHCQVRHPEQKIPSLCKMRALGSAKVKQPVREI